jgi:Protein of unknown function (DUF2844)
MKLRVAPRVWLLSATIAAGATWSCAAFAALGEPESALKAEVQLSRASIKESDRGTYRVHEIELPTGTVVREYAALDGNVFAVTWHGPFVPNLKQALGRYFDEFAAGAKAARSDRHHVQLKQSDLVVQSAGHMRAVSGRAYLPQAMPSGVSVGDLE